MAVVVSQSQNEIGDLRAQGVDITPHRQRMNTEDLDAKFKDPEDPFRIVFVCAMWMTGFDVPACSTIYLDKPQRNHTLMQTIARANRVFADKANGLIVDYIGIFRNLEQALAIYAEAQMRREGTRFRINRSLSRSSRGQLPRLRSSVRTTALTSPRLTRRTQRPLNRSGRSQMQWTGYWSMTKPNRTICKVHGTSSSYTGQFYPMPRRMSSAESVRSSTSSRKKSKT